MTGSLIHLAARGYHRTVVTIGLLTYLERIESGLGGILGPPALKVNVDRGTSRFNDLVLSCGFTVKGPATIPSPVSTRAWPLDPALDPKRGISFLAWKLRGLLPRTTIGAVVASLIVTFVPLDKVPITLRCRTKCCCSSFRRPLLAVALFSPVSFVRFSYASVENAHSHSKL